MKKTKINSLSDFTELLTIKISRKLPKQIVNGLSISPKAIFGANHSVRHMLEFIREDNSMIPLFNMDEAYESYRSEMDIDSIATEIAQSYVASLASPVEPMPFDPDFNDIKDHLALRIINIEKDPACSDSIPYYPVDFGLALICDIRLEDGEGSAWRAHVIRDFLGDETEKTLFEYAFANINNVDPPILRSTFPHDTRGNGAEDLLRGERAIPDHKKEPMYVLTTRGGYFGASAFFYPGIMKKVSDKIRESYYVIPSSVHEVIIIPSSREPELSVLEKILRETNETPGCDTDAISDYIWYYDRDSDTLSIASDNCRS